MRPCVVSTLCGCALSYSCSIPSPHYCSLRGGLCARVFRSDCRRGRAEGCRPHGSPERNLGAPGAAVFAPPPMASRRPWPPSLTPFSLRTGAGARHLSPFASDAAKGPADLAARPRRHAEVLAAMRAAERGFVRSQAGQVPLAAAVQGVFAAPGGARRGPRGGRRRWPPRAGVRSFFYFTFADGKVGLVCQSAKDVGANYYTLLNVN